MLNKIRKPSLATGSWIKKIFAYVFFGLICLILVLFMPVTSQLTGGGSIAYIGKQSISPREYNLVVENMKAQYADRLDKAGLEEAEQLENQIRRTVLNQLTDIYVIFQVAEKEGFSVADRLVQEQIQSVPAFQSNGRFIYSRYREALKSRNFSPGSYEERVRRDILFQNWRDLFFTALKSNALEEEKTQDSFKMKVRFALLDDKIEASQEKELQLLLKEGKYSEANQFLKSLNITWKTSPEFPPSFQKTFQFDNSEALLQAVLNHLPKKGFLPRVIHSREKRYVAEVLSFRQESLDKEKEQQRKFSFLLSYEKPLRIFRNWLNTEKQSANVRINEKYFKSLSP